VTLLKIKEDKAAQAPSSTLAIHPALKVKKMREEVSCFLLVFSRCLGDASLLVARLEKVRLLPFALTALRRKWMTKKPEKSRWKPLQKNTLTTF
jgi:hypothetical protein